MPEAQILPILPTPIGPAAAPERTLWHSDHVDDPDAPSSEELEGAPDETRQRVYLLADANLVGSWADTNPATPEGQPMEVGLSSGVHLPCLDLDVPARLVPSSTPGNSHLFIDVPMTWDKYCRVLEVLADVGILERGYVEASLNRGQTFLRAHRSKPVKGDWVSDGERFGTVTAERRRGKPLHVRWDGSDVETPVQASKLFKVVPDA